MGRGGGRPTEGRGLVFHTPSRSSTEREPENSPHDVTFQVVPRAQPSGWEDRVYFTELYVGLVSSTLKAYEGESTFLGYGVPLPSHLVPLAATSFRENGAERGSERTG